MFHAIVVLYNVFMVILKHFLPKCAARVLRTYYYNASQCQPEILICYVCLKYSLVHLGICNLRFGPCANGIALPLLEFGIWILEFGSFL